ncbi:MULTISPECIES: DUF3592 domain-containing protein [Actinomadura]|uniref:DUF3592 domain-containing protein n=1 Tax=Actinomadura madurae TaxID=1993 RepID=A0A1I5DAH0_9ACTN|nr:DUF3592 domain-containing protein [Actinomadura madurae]SFN96193.1 Protein of unknown function [Actinomadura madurae]SPT50403.1 Protein of uncharacterised function (DUF3592) [Actinomadura madurae]
MLEAFAVVAAVAFMLGWLETLAALARMLRTRAWPVTTCTALEIREKDHYEDGTRHTLYSPVVEFTTHDGRHVRDVLGDWSTGLILKIGESARLRYNPARPEQFRLTGFGRSGLSTRLFILFFAPTAACLILWWFVLRP